MATGELVYPSQGRGPQHGLIVHVAGAVDQVFAQSAAEQVNILRGIADVMPQVVNIQLANINPVDQHIAAVGLVKAN
ncbi:hypothetical protein D3C79_977180 [compost metagenome]